MVTDISKAWLKAAEDLEIRVIAPFRLESPDGSSEIYEAYIRDFGGPKGALALKIGDPSGSKGTQAGYFVSKLGEDYRSYERQLFIDTLDDWGWYGDKKTQPAWYTGKPWS
jgi:hypothetical protein